MRIAVGDRYGAGTATKYPVIAVGWVIMNRLGSVAPDLGSADYGLEEQHP